MNILILSFNLPSPQSGASTRNYQVLKMLAAKHNCSLLAFQPGGSDKESAIAAIEQLASSVHVIPWSEPAKRRQQLVSTLCGKSYTLQSYYRREMQDAIDALVAHEHYDVVLYESVLMATYRLPKHVKVIIDQHNIEFEVRQRTYQQERTSVRKWYNWLESHLIRAAEIERCRSAHTVLVTSEREHLILKRLLPTRVIQVLPNGVDTKRFQKDDVLQEVPGRIIFTGSMEYYPNVQAVLFFAQRCWPLIRAQLPTATWQIIGKNPLPEVLKLAELPGVTVIGSVPDMRPYLAQAEVALAPLLIGSGTRLKILEALAMQKAVVSTSLGCEGLVVIPGKHLLVADQPERFAQAVLNLLLDPQLRAALGNAGRVLVEETYNWEHYRRFLWQIFEDVLL
ncbi:MAG: glycosyltransferase [Chloroflexi bacterium]|nr:MAG: glycosyltransferase [Chloroflexota bacterium]